MAVETRAESTDFARMHNELPCRSQQIDSLLGLFGEPSHWTYPSLFIYGHTATGKTLVVTALLQTLRVPHAVLNCIECYSQRNLFEGILNQLSSYVPGPDNGYSALYRCDNVNDFIRLLRKVIETEKFDKETVYIVLDKADRLRGLDLTLLPALVRLQELTGNNVCVVFISELVWEKFRCGTGLVEPYQIHFPNYSRAELVEILSLDCPSEYGTDFYRNYVNMLLGVFHLACRDLNELRYLAQLNFARYRKPVDRGEATEQDVRKLWKNIEPHLKTAIDSIYLREVSSSQWERMQSQTADEETIDGDLSQLPQTLAPRASVELPYYSKFLLIAAYLASYNPAKSDRRFFSKGRVKRTKQTKGKKTASSQLLGPKIFALNRLLAIFYAIGDERIVPTANIFTQVSSLVTLKLLAQASGDEQIDGAKYRCLVSLDFIRSIGRSVRFNVLRYLYDFI
ncbi:PREDICTED: origin recognition complex subunit 5-like [Priapulus caudatus]|uniref:Origin recognition complex subunit 5-like n=1 Tax=Priapulus caudatus TaxID=37621 RepID=A0ABM1F0J4_PRICU|nr:PREDICTED: origin recognition complex subunit 5-like [Priapulus caudatus]